MRRSPPNIIAENSRLMLDADGNYRCRYGIRESVPDNFTDARPHNGERLARRGRAPQRRRIRHHARRPRGAPIGPPPPEHPIHHRPLKTLEKLCGVDPSRLTKR